jgi:hypothetical protein
MRCCGAAQLWRYGGLHATVRAFSASPMLFSDKAGPDPNDAALIKQLKAGLYGAWDKTLNEGMLALEAVERATTDEERAMAEAELKRCRELLLAAMRTDVKTPAVGNKDGKPSSLR